MAIDHKISFKTLKKICNQTVLRYPEAICLACIELDCGCVHTCGVSVTGAPVGELVRQAPEPDETQTAPPICMICRQKDAAVTERIVNRSIIWPGKADEKPDYSLRQFIGQEVFGADYEEPEN